MQTLFIISISLISKWKSGPYFNKEILQQVTREEIAPKEQIAPKDVLICSKVFSIYL